MMGATRIMSCCQQGGWAATVCAIVAATAALQAAAIVGMGLMAMCRLGAGKMVVMYSR